MVRVKNRAEGIGLGAETEEEKVEQISESTFGTKRAGKNVEFSIKRWGECRGSSLGGTFNNMQGYMQFSLDYFYKSLAGCLWICAVKPETTPRLFSAPAPWLVAVRDVGERRTPVIMVRNSNNSVISCRRLAIGCMASNHRKQAAWLLVSRQGVLHWKSHLFATEALCQKRLWWRVATCVTIQIFMNRSSTQWYILVKNKMLRFLYRKVKLD